MLRVHRLLCNIAHRQKTALAIQAPLTMPPKKARVTATSSTASTSANGGARRVATDTVPRACWLMKAEPDPRLERGIDVSFGVDKFAAMPDQTTQWDGVRNPEARTMMKEVMRVGDCVLFYHSNCKLPGIAGLAHVVREGYPDYTAWDSAHPYFDPKTDKEQPKWYMVDVQLDRKLPRLVPLALLQDVRNKGPAAAEIQALPNGYLGPEHVEAISNMQLLNRGRLSVQRVEPLAYEAIVLLAERGGWEAWPGKWNTQSKEQKSKEQKTATAKGNEEKTRSAKSALAPSTKRKAATSDETSLRRPRTTRRTRPT